MRKSSGRRSRTRTDRKRGRYVQARPTPGKAEDLAFDATLRAAAPFQKERHEQRKRVAFAVLPSDYMRKVRVRRAANLVLFLVDASWSMAVAERMAATKGAILSLLTDAYQRRDRVGLVVFQKDRATLVMPPTTSIFLAQRAPLSGLADGPRRAAKGTHPPPGRDASADRADRRGRECIYGAITAVGRSQASGLPDRR
jgi:magnesium chelatase subunit D